VTKELRRVWSFFISIPKLDNSFLKAFKASCPVPPFKAVF
jgi:hypothetical protein